MLDRSDGEVKDRGNFSIRVTDREELSDLLLSRGETAWRRFS